jgi:type VI secretion system protein VasJ
MGATNGSGSDERAGIGAAAISAEAPAGSDCRVLPEFEAIETEIRRLETDGPTAVDWRKVAEGSLAILSTQSKDLLVAAWCAYALHRRERLPGLAVGLSILNGIVAEHWADAFPPARRERARVAAVDWLAGRLAPALGGVTVSEPEAGAAVACQESLAQIEETISAKLEKETLSIGELTRALRPLAEEGKRLIAQAEERERALAAAREAAAAAAAAPPAQQESPSQAATVAAAPAGAPPAVSAGQLAAPSASASLTELNGAIDAAAPVLRAYAQALRQRQPTDPRAYVLVRVASWLRFDELPQQQNGRTFVVTPAEGLEAIQAARAQGKPDIALALAEDMIWTAPFCIDAHRHAYETLGLLGRPYAAAAASVLGMLAYFVQRYAGVLDLAFNDGRPFADDETRALAASAGGGGNGGGASRDPMQTSIQEARKSLGAGRVEEGLSMLADTLRRASSGRQRALWRMAQAQFCLDNGYVAAALPLVDHLDQTVSQRNLEEWEPELAAGVTELTLRTLMHADAGALMIEERRRAALDAARGRMARLDIGAAIRLLRPQTFAAGT